ncbi:MAG: ROK family protein [Burkholderiales bacterium]
MRQFNERIVLQAIRLHGALPKADVARLTRLSTQTASVIINGLLEDGLVVKQDRVRGRIGQPSVPIALNPDGAFTLGIKVGRRSLDVLAMDFAGQVRVRESLDYEFPDPAVVLPGIEKRMRAVAKRLGTNAHRLVGVGVAAPLWLGGWQGFLGAPPDAMSHWNEIDIHAHIQTLTDLPVEFAKDTTAACAAELVVGRGREYRNFLYLFIGTFIGGGLVLDGKLVPGPRGNAGAVASLPGRPTARGEPVQLVQEASGLLLEQMLAQRGFAAAAAHDERVLSKEMRAVTQGWLDRACPALAWTVATSAALLDLDAVVIDGSFDRSLLDAIRGGTEDALDRFSWEGITRPQLDLGSIGADARAMGGAILPLYRHFAPNHEFFLKVGNEPAAG